MQLKMIRLKHLRIVGTPAIDRRLTIPKISIIYKVLEALGGVAKLAARPIFLMVFSIPYGAHAQVAHIGERVPLRGSWQYTLEVATDTGFSNILHQATVTSVPYIWEVPATGVYHWRLDRKRQNGGESSSLASGSFVGLAIDAADSGPVRIAWDEYPGADRYILLARKPSGATSRFSSGYNGLVLPTIREPMVLEVIPYRGGSSIQRTFQMDQSLRLVGVSPPPAQAAAPMVTPEPEVVEPVKSPAPEPTPVPETVPEEPVAELPESQPGTEPPPPPPEKPLTDHDLAGTEVQAEAMTMPTHHLWITLIGVNENLRAQKLEIDLDSTANLPGGAAGFLTTPLSGLTFGAWGRYHDHKATITVQDETGIETDIDIQQSLVRSDFLLGWDLLRGAGATRHSLIAAVAYSLQQYPRLPYVFSGGPGIVPELEKEEQALPGGYLRFGVMLGPVLVELDGTAADLREPEFRTLRVRFGLSYLWQNGFGLKLDLINERLTYSDCSEDAGECLAEGKIRTTIVDNGIGLGISYSQF